MQLHRGNKHKQVHQPLRLSFGLLILLLVLGTIGSCLLINSTLLERYYIRDRERVMREAYSSINQAAVDGRIDSDDYTIELQKLCEKYSIDILVLNADSQTVKSSSYDTNFLSRRLWENLLDYSAAGERKNVEVIEDNGQYTLQSLKDPRTATEYLEAWGFLDNEYLFLIRGAMDNIRDSVRLSNRFLAMVGFAAALIGILIALFFTNKLLKPIRELTEISEQMKRLNFDAKYADRGKNELDLLGRNINELSRTLEANISELRSANLELEKDIAKKEETDAMRREFLSNVSHELKTPIALIQGYAEGLHDGILEDDASREYYSEVIIDEASKMNLLVKKLMTLNQLEFGDDPAVMERFDLASMLRNYLRSAELLAKQKDITVHSDLPDEAFVWADEFRTEEVLQNYFSNAVNHADGDKVIEIRLTRKEASVRVSVFNTGEPIPEDSLDRIWEKFYKVDKARTRAYGGSGVGLSIVRAIMESMHQPYGVRNYDNGVEFWFELPTSGQGTAAEEEER